MRIESPSSPKSARAGRWPRLLWAAALSVLIGLSPLPVRAEGPAGNLTANWSVEEWSGSYGSYNGYPLQVASDWTRFILADHDPRFMKDTEYADCFSSSGAIPRSADGNYSQNLWSGHTFTAGIYQQIAVTPGKGYTAKSWMHTVLGTDPAYPHTAMAKQVGIDPYGGTDPASGNVVWGAPDESNRSFVDVRTAARAANSTVTLFARIISPDESYPDWNAGFMDTLVLFEAPTVSASSPQSSPTTSFTVRWDNAQAAPNGSLTDQYDVQYKDGINGAWKDWKKKKSSTQDVFGPTSPETVQVGHTYYFRARAWQEYSGIELYGAFNPAPAGDTHTTVGRIATGYVRGNTEFAIPGATVTLSGAAGSTTTDDQGGYSLALPANGSYGLTASLTGYGSPPPVPFTVLTNTVTVPITVTLRPAVDAVLNGDFESNLGNWTASGGAETQGTVVRSGTKSARLPGGGRIEQSFNVQGMYEPVLSFYARTNMGSAGAGLIVGRTQPNPTPLWTLTGSNGEWRHYYVNLGVGEEYTGPLGIYFQASQAGAAPMQVYLDEASVGRSPGGPNAAFLPVILK